MPLTWYPDKPVPAPQAGAGHYKPTRGFRTTSNGSKTPARNRSHGVLPTY
jgi:hypothetical protein